MKIIVRKNMLMIIGFLMIFTGISFICILESLEYMTKGGGLMVILGSITIVLDMFDIQKTIKH